MWYVYEITYHFEELLGVVLAFEGQSEFFIPQGLPGKQRFGGPYEHIIPHIGIFFFLARDCIPLI